MTCIVVVFDDNNKLQLLDLSINDAETKTDFTKTPWKCIRDPYKCIGDASAVADRKDGGATSAPVTTIILWQFYPTDDYG